MAPVQWNDANEKQLLLLIINHFAPTVPLKLWDELAKQMGGDFKGEGLRKKYAKLRKDAEEAYGKPAEDGEDDEIAPAATTTTTTTTVAAAKSNGEAKTAAPKTTNGKRKARGKAASTMNQEDGEDSESSEEIVVAAKKTKSTKGKA